MLPKFKYFFVYCKIQNTTLATVIMTTTMMMMMATMTLLMELSVVDIQTGFHPFQVSVVTLCVAPLKIVRILLRGVDMTMDRGAAACHVRT
jgi:hypothetical protein